jgi:hypothetical protein
LVVLVAVLLMAMKVTTDAINAGAPSWLNLVVLALAWDAIKVAMVLIVVASRGVARLTLAAAGSLRFATSNRIRS